MEDILLSVNDGGRFNGFLEVVVSNYTNSVRSVEMSLETPLARLGLARYNIHIVIDAPSDSDIKEIEGQHVFFVESCQRLRELGEGHYQIVYEGAPEDKQGFASWAEKCVEFFKLMQFHIGVVCVDYADFRTVLQDCKGRALRFEWLPYDQYDVVPYSKHKGSAYRTLYCCICGLADSSLQQYVEFTKVLEAENPNLVMTKAAMTIGQYDPPVMMLLGEMDESHVA
jgi:hypothetical protein